MSEARQRRLQHFESNIFQPEVNQAPRNTYAYAKYHESNDLFQEKVRSTTPDPSQFTSNWKISTPREEPKQIEFTAPDLPSVQEAEPVKEPPKRIIRSRTPILKMKQEEREKLKLNKENAVSNETNDEKQNRVNDRCYSNLFGREFKSHRDTTPDRLNCMSTKWLQASQHIKSTPQKETHDVKDFKEQQLSSHFNNYETQKPPRDVTPTKAERPPQLNLTPKEMRLQNLFTPVRQTYGKKPETDSFVIKGLHPHDDATSIKSLCNGMHVVSITPDIDDIKGRCTGSAKIQIRHDPSKKTFERFQQNLGSVGYTVERPASVGIKRSIPRDTSPLDLNATNQQNKMKFLENSDDLFGSSPGIGRYTQLQRSRGITMSRDNLNKSREALHGWNSAKKTPAPARAQTPGKRPPSRFMKPTRSSQCKQA